MEIEWSDMALAQLGDVIEYVSENFGERVALETYDKVDARVKGLVRFPESGRYDGVKLSSKYPLRHLVIAPNVLYYFIDTEYEKIVLLAFVHSKQSTRTVNSILKKSLDIFRNELLPEGYIHSKGSHSLPHHYFQLFLGDSTFFPYLCTRIYNYKL